MKNLVMAGGVALNCVANGRLMREGPFEQLWVQPAAGDAGGALGAAMFAEHCVLGRPRRFRMDHAFWGPSFSDAEIRRYLESRKAPYRSLPREEMIRETARLLDEKQAVVGWFQGRMEWGPRSLGSRSILADARNRENWQRVNLKIKFRESFRPFAPAVPGREERRVVRDRPREPLHAARVPGEGHERNGVAVLPSSLRDHARGRLGARSRR